MSDTRSVGHKVGSVPVTGVGYMCDLSEVTGARWRKGDNLIHLVTRPDKLQRHNLGDISTHTVTGQRDRELEIEIIQQMSEQRFEFPSESPV